MLDSIETAIQVIRDYDPRTGDPEKYHEACEYLVDHRADLKQQVFINLLGGLDGNSDTRWDKVKNGSLERCSCGNERVIIPLNLRSTFEPGVEVILADKPLCLKPVGGDLASTYVRFEVQEGIMLFEEDPFAPFVLSMSLFQRPGYPLETLAELLKEEELLFRMDFDGQVVPITKIVGVDRNADTVTLVLDMGVEAFDPDAFESHNCF